VHRGAGALHCGEETRSIESIEGERGMPRPQTTFTAAAGLYAQADVVVNKVEHVDGADIVTMGGAGTTPSWAVKQVDRQANRHI